jgi:uncharacterized protein DUF2511
MKIALLALVVLVFACGAPRTVVTPQPTKEAAIVATPQPTIEPTPAPTAAPKGYVSHAEMGDAWPLTVEDGTIICSGTAILLRTNRGLFAVNGAARAQRKWKDIRDITKPDPQVSGLIMSVQPIIDRGLSVCR